MVPVFTSHEDAEKVAAEIRILGVRAAGLQSIHTQVRVMQRVDADAFSVTAALRDPRTGNMVVRDVAPGETPSAVVAAIKADLAGRAKATRGAIAREKART